MSNVLTSGTAQKAAGDTVRLPMDFGDISALNDGAYVQDGALVMPVNIADYDITPPLGPSAPTVSDVQLDYPYQMSGKFSGGVAGTTYDIVFTITLDDADGTVVSRTGPLKVL